MSVKNYELDFTNGLATADLPVGTYTYVSNTIAGYSEGATVESFTVTPTTSSIDITITADGTLNITVVDDLDTPITEGSVQLSNNDGTTRYGTAATIDSSGLASFANVPYDATGISLFVAQDASDDSHDPIDTPQAVSMTETPQSETILNDRKAIAVGINLTDAIYAGITPINGTLTVNG